MEPLQRALLAGNAPLDLPGAAPWQHETQTWTRKVGLIEITLGWHRRTGVWSFTAPGLGIHNPIALESVTAEDAMAETDRRLVKWLTVVLADLEPIAVALHDRKPKAKKP